MYIVSQSEFSERLEQVLDDLPPIDYVTGPGRSGAIASVYASYMLRVPFVPYGSFIPDQRALIVDTAINTGKTLRKASRHYGDAPFVYAFREPPRVHFWYECLEETPVEFPRHLYERMKELVKDIDVDLNKRLQDND